MQVVLNDDGPCLKTMQVDLPVEVVQSEYATIMKMYKKQASIPGFRKGKAPDAVIATRFGKQIQEELNKNLTQKAYTDATTKENLTVMNVPKVSEVEANPKEAYSINFTIETKPEFELGDYKSYTVESETKEVTPERIDEELQRILEQRAQFADVTDRPVIEGDLVSFSIDGTCEGMDYDSIEDEQLKSLFKNDQMMTMANTAMEVIPGFGLGVVGMSINDEKEITSSYPADFAQELIAGKDVVYKVTVTAIQERALPELNEELLASLGVKTEEELRDMIKGSVENMFKREERVKQAEAIADQLLAEHDFDVPMSAINEETDRCVQDLVQKNTQRGVSKEELVEKKDEIYEQAKQRATRTVKLKYLVQEIAEKEKVSVEEEEFKQYLSQMAMSYQMDPKTLVDTLIERNIMGTIQQELLNNKTLDKLVTEALKTEEGE